MKIYIGGPMFTEAEVQYNLLLAQEIRSIGFEVYCPNENLAINDKSKSDITGERIYQADVIELESANIFLCQIAEDSGTMWEAGYMDCLSKRVDQKKWLGCIGLTTDIRLKTIPHPEKHGIDNQSAYLNQFIIGGLKLSLGVYTCRTTLKARLSSVRSEFEA
jgi:hypothetical protein